MIPASLIRIKSSSLKARKSIIAGYNALAADSVTPDYLLEKDIVASHMIRSEEELRCGAQSPLMGRLSYTRNMAGGRAFSPEGGVLTEVCIGAMAEVLSVKGEQQVAAGFFSSMVASIDDLLDMEDSYAIHGERLFYISHAYRDLMDLALEREVERGNIARGQLLEIKNRLFEVTKTLAASEKACPADEYLYKKSCGDLVIAALFPSSDADEELKSRCAQLGRLVGETGQLIDDLIDYDHDMASGKKNYIALTGSGLQGALGLIDSRLKKAFALASEVNSRAVTWILGALAKIAGIFSRQLESGKRITAALLEMPLRPVLPTLPRNQFFLWF